MRAMQGLMLVLACSGFACTNEVSGEPLLTPEGELTINLSNASTEVSWDVELDALTLFDAQYTNTKAYAASAVISSVRVKAPAGPHDTFTWGFLPDPSESGLVPPAGTVTLTHRLAGWGEAPLFSCCHVGPVTVEVDFDVGGTPQTHSVPSSYICDQTNCD